MGNPVPTEPICIDAAPAVYLGIEDLEQGNRVILPQSIL